MPRDGRETSKNGNRYHRLNIGIISLDNDTESASLSKNLHIPLDKVGRFIEDASCPDISEAMVEKTLASLLAAGFIRKLGAGRATSYAKTAP